MTISTAVVSKTLVCDGSSSVFALTGLKYFATTDLAVQKIVDGVATDLTLGTHYTLTGTGTSGSGVLTTTSVYAAGVKIFVLRNTDDVQQQQYPEGGGFPSADTERAFDRRTMRSQELAHALHKTIHVGLHDADQAPVTPVANRAIVFDENGQATTSEYNPDEMISLASASVLVAQSAADSAAASAVAASSNPSYPMVRVRSHAALVAMTWAQMHAAQCVILDSFYENGNAGGNIFVWRSGSATPNGYYVIAGSDDPTGTHGALYCMNPQWRDVDFGVQEGVDAAEIYQTMVNCCPPGTIIKTLVHSLVFSSGVVLPHPYIGFKGLGMSPDTGNKGTVVSGTITSYVFTYLSDVTGINDGGSIVSALSWDGYLFLVPFAIQVNQKGDGTHGNTDNFARQYCIRNVKITNCMFYPYTKQYSSGNDALVGTSAEVTDISDLVNYSCAVSLHKCYNVFFAYNRVSRYGLGLWLHGCDLAVSFNNVYDDCARFVHAVEVGTATDVSNNTWGGGLKRICDQYTNGLRLDAVYDGSWGGVDDGCYYECYSPAGRHVRYVGFAHHSANNRYTSNKSGSTAIIYYDSVWSCVSANNTVESSIAGDGGIIIKKPDTWDYLLDPIVSFMGNARKYNERIAKYPEVVIDYNDRLYWSPRNPKPYNGSVALNGWFWEYNALNALYITSSSFAGNLTVTFDVNPDETTFTLYITGIWPSTTSAYMKVTWGGVLVTAAYVGPSAVSNYVQTVSISLIRPSGVNGYSAVVVEFTALPQVLLHSLELK